MPSKGLKDWPARTSLWMFKWYFTKKETLGLKRKKIKGNWVHEKNMVGNCGESKDGRKLRIFWTGVGPSIRK